jgi:hypothetical protein
MEKKPSINIPENNNNAFITAKYNNAFNISKTRKIPDPMNIRTFPVIPKHNQKKLNVTVHPESKKSWYQKLFESKQPAPKVLGPMNRSGFPRVGRDPRLKTIKSGSTTYTYNLTAGGYRKKLKHRRTHRRYHTRK